MSLLHRGLRLVLILALLLPMSSTGAARRARELGPRPVVIAIIGERALNVFHRDFQKAPEHLPEAIPVDRVVDLPGSGSFEQRVEEAAKGPLGELEPRTLYWVRGTRILIWHGGRLAYDVLGDPDTVTGDAADSDRYHGTGVASSAVGRAHGTAPDGFILFMPGVYQREAYSWIGQQPWVDVSSSSVYSPLTCELADPIRELDARGRVVFRSSGNFEQTALVSDNGLPEVYQVGGVDDQGRTYLPGTGGLALGVTPTRPYETGDRFDFPAAHPDAFSGSVDFGGTSGASPTTAGRAAMLIRLARRLLRDGSRTFGALAHATSAARRPAGGPLADGTFTAQELADVLHRVAVPAEPPSKVRYMVEGFGALNNDAMEVADAVLRGSTPLPPRPEEEEMHRQVDSLRATWYQQPRC